MDPTLIIGWILAIVLIVNGITVQKLGNFIDIPSLLIVLGGTVAALIACYPVRVLSQIPKHIAICVRGGRKYNVPKVVEQIVDLALIARQSGLLALEEKAEEIKEPFFKQAVVMIVDANDPDKVRAALERQVEDMMSRHDEARGMYLKGSALAPAFGMIGTLVGLVNMLKGMDMSGSGGANTLGQDMGVALITTFYGSALSNVFFHPIAQKLGIKGEEEVLYCSTIIEGVIAIQSGDNPKVIRERLLSSLTQKQSKKLLAKAAPAGGGEAS
ncbi:MotA/TolQ/ExbB proton channel family protein [Oribacterium sp. oral taxon 102]|uniref:motility protein A n=1 Tax=Oribacterium sp. oral taxon 102 TaxID=671214 RepID=UPI0015BDDBAF|nr:MotA/TolQ/ExbB proton channel family protein [Oribacterium sp. oral taxon 102]NWO21807.1 MotA/TolQ/ExbB proton channel family protein [Oribacterium sp. oral taxon 102]